MTTPYETSTMILDAAAAGRIEPGYEQVGGLLLELAATTSVPVGAAIGSGAVAAASRLSAPGRFAAASLRLKTGAAMIVLGAVVVIVGLSVAPDRSSIDINPGERPPGEVGVDRVVVDPEDLDNSPAPGGAPVSSTTAETDAASTTAPVRPPATTTTASEVVPTTAVAEAATTTTVPEIAPPTTTTSAPVAVSTTTVAGPDPTTTTTEAQGNNGNGNGNGNGVGNGKGNQGHGEGRP